MQVYWIKFLQFFLFLGNFETHLSKFSCNSQSKLHIMYGFTIYFWLHFYELDWDKFVGLKLFKHMEELRRSSTILDEALQILKSYLIRLNLSQIKSEIYLLFNNEKIWGFCLSSVEIFVWMQCNQKKSVFQNIKESNFMCKE